MRVPRGHSAGLALFLAVLLGSPGWPTVVAGEEPPAGPAGMRLALPERDDAGEWDGTWYYRSKDFRVAAWIRTEDGVPRIKLQLINMGSAESFATDWQGHAEYVTRHFPGRFSLDITAADADTIEADWYWFLGTQTSSRTETAKVTIYRAGMGRVLVMRFDQYERRVLREGQAKTITAPQGWTFRKGSKRLVEWAELPF